MIWMRGGMRLLGIEVAGPDEMVWMFGSVRFGPKGWKQEWVAVSERWTTDHRHSDSPWLIIEWFSVDEIVDLQRWRFNKMKTANGLFCVCGTIPVSIYDSSCWKVATV